MSEWNTRHTLLKRARNNQDTRAWEEFVYYYRPYLYQVSRRMQLNHHDAEEVTQLSLVKLWKALPDFEYNEKKGRFRGWLCTITGNTAKTFMRSEASRNKRHDRMKNGEIEGYLDEINEPEINEIAESEWRIYVANLAWENIKGDLHNNARDAFLMFSEGVKVPEIAKRLGLADESIYVYKKRVEWRLFKEIKSLEEDLG